MHARLLEILMRPLVILAFLASSAAAQDTAGDTIAPYQLRVRAADSTKQLAMTIGWTARIFSSIGGVPGKSGGVSVGPGGGSGYGLVAATIANRPGSITFTSVAGAPLELTLSRTDTATPMLVARGKVVTVAVAADGQFSVASWP